MVDCEVTDILRGEIQSQLKQNEELQKKYSENDDKYEHLLKKLEDIRASKMNDPRMECGANLSINERLDLVAEEIKEAAIEREILSCRLKDSSTLLEKLNRTVDEIEQYMKRENLLIKGLSGIPTRLKGYKFSMWVADKINRLIPNLDFLILPQHISVSHPLYKKGEMTNVVIVRFAIRDVRNEIFYKKKYITNNNVFITEHLTPYNQNLLTAAKELLGTKNAWSSQTKIFGKINDEVHRITSPNDLDHLNSLKVASPVSSSSRNDGDPATVTDASEATAQVEGTNEIINNIPKDDISLLLHSWPDLTQADLITAIKDFEKKSKSRGGREYTDRGRGHMHRGRGTRNRGVWARRGGGTYSGYH